MQLFVAVAVWSVFSATTASCSGHAECDADTDETSMLQVHARMQSHDADHAELLALQQQVGHLSNIEAQQIKLIGEFCAWAGKQQLDAVQGLPMLLQNLAPAQGYIAVMKHIGQIGNMMISMANEIDGNAASPAEAVQSFLEKYRVALEQTMELAGEFSPEDHAEGVFAQWCPGMHLMAVHVRDMFSTEGLETNADALAQVSQDSLLLLQGVEMKNLQTQQLSEEQAVALKQHLKAALSGLTTQEGFIKKVGDKFVKFCQEDIGENCPPMDYPFLHGPILKMVEGCVNTFSQVKALGNMAGAVDIEVN